MPESPPSSESEGKGKGRFLAFWTTLPGILTGVAALLTAIVGLVALLTSGGGGSNAPASAQRSASVTTPATTSVTKPGTASAKTSEVLAHGRLALTRGDYADLERDLIEISPNADLIFGPESTPNLFAAPPAFLSPTKGPASKRACTTALSARHDAFEILPQLDTRWVCVSTSEGHVAVVRIVTLPGVGSAELVLGYTVWR